MAALYGRVHGLGPRQQTRKAMNKETDAGAVHMETIRATITERPGLGGGWWQRRRWWWWWGGGGTEGAGGRHGHHAHRETQAGREARNERHTRGAGEVSFGCLSFHKAFAATSGNELR